MQLSKLSKKTPRSVVNDPHKGLKVDKKLNINILNVLFLKMSFLQLSIPSTIFMKLTMPN